MALPRKDLTEVQSAVVKSLVANFEITAAKLAEPQRLHDIAIQGLEEYSKQIAETLGIDIVNDYIFDISSQAFIDRAMIAAPATVTK